MPSGDAYDGAMTPNASRVRLPAWAQDLALGLLVAAMQLVGTHRLALEQPAARPLGQPGGLGWAILAVSGLVLLERRRWPAAVFLLTAALSAVYYTAGYPDGPGWIALFVAAYTINARGDGERSVRLVGWVVIVLTAVWLLEANLSPLLGAGWVFFRIGTLITAAVLGDMLRARRVVAEEALERAERAERTREQEARRRVDAERLRIAREVHDTVAHAIAVINVQAGVTAHVLDRRPERARETLLTIERTSARALGELRATLGMLRDKGGGPAPGLARVEELAGLAREAGLEVELELRSPPPDMPAEVDQAAYRIVQESITNAIRHAGPARVRVSVAWAPGELELLVADNGRGPCEPNDTGGRGIVGMRERASLLGGELTAGAGPDGGFQVKARLPLPVAVAEA